MIQVNTFRCQIKNAALQKRFWYWLKWWDSSVTTDTFYDEGVLHTCLQYAKRDLGLT